MSILDRESLEKSPLADLHAIASELSIDGYRRLRKAELIDALVARQEGTSSQETEDESEQAPDETSEDQVGDDGPSGPRRRWRRGGRGRGSAEDEPSTGQTDEEAGPEDDVPAEPEASERPRPRSKVQSATPEQEVIEGVVELLPGGSGFVRVHPPDPSDDDVYISSAQIKRCELVTGDRVSGPRRPPRRSERFASLLRVDTVNDLPASELADSVRFEDRPVGFPDRRLGLAESDHGLSAIDRAAPFGRGSRVVITGPSAAGKTQVLRRVAAVLAGDPELQVWLVLVGVRPEEQAEWQKSGIAPAVSLSFAVSADAQSQALDGVVEQVRRLVARGGDAVILIDTLDDVIPAVARKALVSSRNLTDGGSLTVIATASAPLGGETTVIALERPQAGGAEFPLVDAAGSWTIRRELLG